jgi:hypothetical protein
MKRLNMCAIAASVSLALVIPAQAGDGRAIAAGVLGGLAAGAIIGGAAAQPRYYAPPPPAYVYEPAPVYAAPACYWTRGEPVWDDYRGIWVRPRVRVCD